MEPVQLDWMKCARIQLLTHSGKICIAAVYLPPRYTISHPELSSQLKNLGPKFLIGGDFNAKHTWWGSRIVNPKGSTLLKCVKELGCNLHSTGEPTYWPSDHNKIPDLLDLGVSRGIDPAKVSTVGCNELCSDHSMVKVLLRTSLLRTPGSTKLIRRNTDTTGFRRWLEENVDPHPAISTGGDIDEAAASLTGKIHQAARMATPTPCTNSGRLQVARRDNHLWSTELASMVSEKRRLRRVWQFSRPPSDKRAYNRACKQLKQMLHDTRSKALEEYLIELEPGNAEHNIWNATKYLKRPVRRVPPVKTAAGVWCRSSQEKADAFADHLETSFQPFTLCGDEDIQETTQFVDAACPMDLPIAEIGSQEILDEISCLKLTKSPGYDKIDAAALKLLPTNCIEFLKVLMNQCLRLGHFPSKWKCAEVILIHKTGKSDAELGSYRPISLLAILSKILEKLFLKRLVPILEEKRIIPDHQFGFRQGHGAVQQCHRVVTRVLDAFENKKYCAAVFLDVKQAFDRVWHLDLLFKLKKQLPAPHYMFLKAYVEERRFYVRSSYSESPQHVVRAGVPQGSVVGPVLYSIFTSDMPVSEDNRILTCTHADDTALLCSDVSPAMAAQGLQHELDMIQPWLKRWNITINADKSTYVTFTLRPNNCPPVHINGTNIPSNEKAKYLGLTLDKRHTWKDHIGEKVKLMRHKCRAMTWLLGRRSTLRIKHKLLLYKAIIKPAWMYGVELWGSASSSHIKKLQRTECRIFRFILNSPYYVRNTTIKRDLKMPSVAEEIAKTSRRYLHKLESHENHLAINLLDNSTERRRLKRFHPLDLPFRVP